RSVADLKGKRLGVAGSPLDKGWLILRLLTIRNDGFDLDGAAAEKSFGAPPLLSEQLAGGRLDAVLTYWPYAARLEAQGMRSLVSIGDALRELGVPDDLPMIGYVFSEQWAAANRAVVDGFLKASGDAKRILADSDEEWRTIMPLTGAKDEAELARLRDAFRAGIPKEQASAAAEQEAAGKLYALLASLGGEALVGPSPTLRPGTFYPMPAD
ncbi:MAG TPA: ABC transporter substrate-binding protein, partial [Stellaceae bacterium]